MIRVRHILFIGVVVLCLSACTPSSPSVRYEIGELLLEEDFSRPFAWETYADPVLQVDLRVEDGSYRVQARDGGFMWGLNATVHTDVLIEVEVEQFSTYADNAFGVMCRADPDADGDGYYFFISGDGHYTLRRGRGDEVLPLIQWTPSSVIVQGQARNRIRVICIQDYLALYVNDRFVAEARDRLYSSGVTGLTAAIPEGGDVEVRFDDLLIFSARLAASS